MSIDTLSFYWPLPKLGVKFSNQIQDMRANSTTTASLARQVYADIDPSAADKHVMAGLAVGELAFEKRFRIFYDQDNDKFTIQFNTGTNSVPVWTDYFTIRQTDGRVSVTGSGGFEASSFYNLGEFFDSFYLVVRGSTRQKKIFLNREAGIVFDSTYFYLNAVSNPDEILVSLTPTGSGGEANTASNLGSGSGLFSSKSGIDLQFKSLTATSPISLASTATEIDISSSAEANTASSLGGDVDVFNSKSGVDLQFRGLTAGRNVTLSSSSSAITINADTQFYGMNVGETDDDPIFRDIGTIKFNSNRFYVTQQDKDTAIVNFRPISDQGEANTASNLAGDEGIFALKSGVDLQFKSLTAGTNITLSSDSNAITINSSASGGGGGFYGVVFKESESGGFVKRDDTVVFDSAYFYMVSTTDGNPLVSFNPSISNTQQFSTLIAGDPGNEDSAIRVGGTLYEAVFKVSDIGSSNEVSQHIHRHNDSLPPSFLFSRSRGSTNLNQAVQDGDRLAAIYGTGWGDSTYEVGGLITIVVDALDGSTIGDDNVPGKIEFRTQAPGSGALNPALAMTIRADQSISMENTLSVENATTAESFYHRSLGEVVANVSNLGAGEGIGSQQDATLQLKSLVAGTNITLGSDSNTITINSSASGGGGGFYGVLFKESEAGGFSEKDDTLIFDSTYFYIASAGDDSKPLVSLHTPPWAVEDGTSLFENIRKLSLDNNFFYLSPTSDPGVARISFSPNYREKLVTDRAYYVRTDGSDSNDGLGDSASGAFLTIQKALDVAYGEIDLGGFNIDIHIGAGTYTENLTALTPQVGAGEIILNGDVADPTNVVLTSSSGDTLHVENGAVLYLKGIQISSSAGHGIFTRALGVVRLIDNMDFGSTALDAMTAVRGGYIIISTNYSISGNQRYHWSGVEVCLIQCISNTITLTGTPNFSGAFVLATRLAQLTVPGNTFNGSATGKRYDIGSNAVLRVDGAGEDYLPGDSAGTRIKGSIYDASYAAVAFAETESGGYSQTTDVINFDSTYFYLQSNGSGEPVVSLHAPALVVQEVDGNPSVSNPDTIIFPAGSVTDNGDGSATITFNAGSNVTFSETESGGYTNTTDALNFDSTFFYLSSNGSGNPVVSLTGGGSPIQSFNLSSVASVDIELNYSQYDIIDIFFDLMPATDDVDLWLRASTDGGLTFDSGANYSYATDLYIDSVSTNAARVGASGANQMVMGPGSTNTGVGSASGEGASGRITITRVGSGTGIPLIHWHFSLINASGVLRGVNGCGARLVAAQITDLRLLFESGSISSGTVLVYGRRNA